LTVSQFQQFLTFFNTQVTTGLLYYIGCFSGGQNFIDPYKELTTGQPLSLTFTIASDTISETLHLRDISLLPIRWYTPSTSPYDFDQLIKALDIDKKKINIISPYDFFRFFQELQKPLPQLNYIDLFSNISHFTIRTSKGELAIDPAFLSNLPSVRVPGSHWFNVVNIGKHIIELTRVRTATQGNQPLAINQPGTTAKDAVLLYVSNIPFTISVQRSSKDIAFPAIVSMIPDKAKHIFEEIYAPDYSFTEIIAKFFPFGELQSSKFFHIKKLTYLNNVSVPKNRIALLTNIVITNMSITQYSRNNLTNSLFFTDVIGSSYTFSWQPGTPPPSDFSSISKLLPGTNYLKEADQYFNDLPTDISELPNLAKLRKVLEEKKRAFPLKALEFNRQQVSQLHSNLQALATQHKKIKH
jgi:hypothetical protein